MPDRLVMAREIGAMAALRRSDEAPAVLVEGVKDAREAAVIWAREAGRMDAFAAVFAALGKHDLAAQHRGNAALYARKAGECWECAAHA